MKNHSRKGIVTLALLVATAFPATTATTFEAGADVGKGTGRENTTQSGLQIQRRHQERLRLRDGSCLKGTGAVSGTMQRKGNTYGPGDGTGYDGTGPKDGTGYGAPSNR